MKLTNILEIEYRLRINHHFGHYKCIYFSQNNFSFTIVSIEKDLAVIHKNCGAFIIFYFLTKYRKGLFSRELTTSKEVTHLTD